MPKLNLGRSMLVAAAALAVIATGGCTRVREHSGFLIDPLIVDSVLPGIDNKDSVAASLGRPSFASQFGPERWYYISRNTRALAFRDPRPTQQELVTIEFNKDGTVKSITKDDSMKEIAKIDPSGDKTPTLGRKRTVFDDIFGNIGAVGAAGASGGGQGPSGPGPNGS